MRLPKSRVCLPQYNCSTIDEKEERREQRPSWRLDVPGNCTQNVYVSRTTSVIAAAYSHETIGVDGHARERPDFWGLSETIPVASQQDRPEGGEQRYHHTATPTSMHRFCVCS